MAGTGSKGKDKGELLPTSQRRLLRQPRSARTPPWPWPVATTIALAGAATVTVPNPAYSLVHPSVRTMFISTACVDGGFMPALILLTCSSAHARRDRHSGQTHREARPLSPSVPSAGQDSDPFSFPFNPAVSHSCIAPSTHLQSTLGRGDGVRDSIGNDSGRRARQQRRQGGAVENRAVRRRRRRGGRRHGGGSDGRVRLRWATAGWARGLGAADKMGMTGRRATGSR